MTKNKVVLVPFPFEDFSAVKVRPAVCLTNPIGSFRHVIVGFITSKLPEEILDSDVIVEPSLEGFEATGLRVPSAIRLHRLATIPTRIIRSEIGILPPILAGQVSLRLKKLFE
ncbi:MAG: type II toxin-antitoxin system PemK/MazF family toxin [Bacteroidetes bacterium]|nr:type II toxin-antitoxin system PemK/MazF family toxin [Bacteroidota bacterium]MCW5895026.1 type II toxin-antitoxin system PemK/MazF family toxin [Bacteroidota bacterium]